MHKIVLSFLIAGICLLCSGPQMLSAQSFDSPSDYLAAMGQEHKTITSDLWDYMNSVARGKNARKVEKNRAELLNSIRTARKKISALPGYEGDVSLRDGVVKYFDISYSVLNDDYEKIVDMEAIAEQSYDAMEAYLLTQEEANKKLSDAGAAMVETQAEFAKSHNIELIEKEDKTSGRVLIANEVFGYQNRLFLIYFKPYVQDGYLIEALASKDLTAIEQARNAMITYADEGLKVLAKEPAYNGDNSLKLACEDLLQFYKKSGRVSIPAMTDFFVKEEKFNRIKSAFEAKKQKERTQEDVDQYNNAINEVNAALEVYNSTGQETNKTRSELLNAWNKAVQKFLNKHVPR